MAGHLLITPTAEHLQIVKKFNDINKLNEAKCFDKKKMDVREYAQLLPIEEFNMDEETGLKDEFVLSYWKFAEKEYESDIVYEIHIDKNAQINAVYLVS
jgi:hypothetical protein